MYAYLKFEDVKIEQLEKNGDIRYFLNDLEITRTMFKNYITNKFNNNELIDDFYTDENVFFDNIDLFFNNDNEKYIDFSNFTLLTEVYLPYDYFGCTDPNKNPFVNCNNLSIVNVNPQNKYLHSINNNLFFNNKLLTYNLCNKNDTYILEPFIADIAKQAFYGHKYIKQVHLNNNIDTIHEKTFAMSSNLNRINLNNIQEINDFAFFNCKNLSYIKIHKAQVIGECAFAECSFILEVDLPKNMKLIKDKAFENCTYLNKVKFPEYLIKIGQNVFKGCKNLIEIELLIDKINIIEHNAFGNTYIKQKQPYTSLSAR